MRHVILLARAAIAAPAAAELEALAAAVAAAHGAPARHAFTEQGSPCLRAALRAAAADGATDIALVPLMLPFEPNMAAWVARAVARWREEDGIPAHVAVRLGPAPCHGTEGAALAVALAARGFNAPPLPATADKPLGSVVPNNARRVLVCQGGGCNDAGAGAVWQHLRAEQARLGLREAASMMSARTSCLGPCNLAPVVQVWPEGTYYGGVDPARIDRIIAQHLLGGTVAADLAYAPLPGKQRLRARG